jgi:hypothetical protein
MTQMLTIPHQHVTFACGDEGTIRATLTALPDGSAHGHLAVLTRHGARRYRAVSGRCDTVPGQGSSACIQMEELFSPAGLEEIVELTIEPLPNTPATGGRAAFVLERLPDGGEIARAEIRLGCNEVRMAAVAGA